MTLIDAIFVSSLCHLSLEDTLHSGLANMDESDLNCGLLPWWVRYPGLTSVQPDGVLRGATGPRPEPNLSECFPSSLVRRLHEVEKASEKASPSLSFKDPLPSLAGIAPAFEHK